MTDERPDTSHLTPANKNPWYILMTLYGEQEGEAVDRDLHEKNRAVWNAWSCQNLSEVERAKLEGDGVALPEVGAWDEMKEEVARLHREEFEERGGPRTDYTGLPDVAASVDLSEIIFSNTVVLEKMIFSAAADFDSATFSAAADFDSATFSAAADFDSATFGAHASFISATFSAAADFNSATFSAAAFFNSATFSADAYFNSATFSAVAYFISATFGAVAFFNSATFGADAFFNSATFSADAYFNSATFGADASFNSATFSAAAFFNSATFGADAFFNSATFSAAAYFNSATFGVDASFNSATFSAAADFNSATFQAPVRFVETRFGDPEDPKPALLTLTDAQFEKPVSFREAVFLNRYPDFTGTIIHEQSLFPWEPENWPAACDQDPKAGRDSCAVLRHHLSKQGLPEAESFFYRREMGFARQIGSFPARLPYLIYGWLSDYGHSIVRPVNGLLILFFIGAFAVEMATSFGLIRSLGYSFANMFKFFGLHGTYFDNDVIQLWPAWLQWLSGAQTVLSFILLFFLGLGLRTRFRLR